MIRILLAVLAMVAVPFLIYFLHDLVRGGPDGKGVRNPKDWERDSVLSIGFVGLFLATLTVIAVVTTGGGSREGSYTPARIENGKLIDGGFNQRDSSPERSLTLD